MTAGNLHELLDLAAGKPMPDWRLGGFFRFADQLENEENGSEAVLDAMDGKPEAPGEDGAVQNG